MNIQDTLSKLPASWDEIKMHQYQRILELTITESPAVHFDQEEAVGDIFDGVENSIACMMYLDSF